MDEDDKGWPIIRMGVSGWVFLLVPVYLGCPDQRLCVLGGENPNFWGVNRRFTAKLSDVFAAVYSSKWRTWRFQWTNSTASRTTSAELRPMQVCPHTLVSQSVGHSHGKLASNPDFAHTQIPGYPGLHSPVSFPVNWRQPVTALA